MYNKRQLKKTNDKKILHKVRKHWIVVSSMVLMALGGMEAVNVHVTHADVNASSNDSGNNSAILQNRSQNNRSRLTKPSAITSAGNNNQNSRTDSAQLSTRINQISHRVINENLHNNSSSALHAVNSSSSWMNSLSTENHSAQITQNNVNEIRKYGDDSTLNSVQNDLVKDQTSGMVNNFVYSGFQPNLQNHRSASADSIGNWLLNHKSDHNYASVSNLYQNYQSASANLANVSASANTYNSQDNELTSEARTDLKDVNNSNISNYETSASKMNASMSQITQQLNSDNQLVNTDANDINNDVKSALAIISNNKTNDDPDNFIDNGVANVNDAFQFNYALTHKNINTINVLNNISLRNLKGVSDQDQNLSVANSDVTINGKTLSNNQVAKVDFAGNSYNLNNHNGTVNNLTMYGTNQNGPLYNGNLTYNDVDYIGSQLVNDPNKAIIIKGQVLVNSGQGYDPSIIDYRIPAQETKLDSVNGSNINASAIEFMNKANYTGYTHNGNNININNNAKNKFSYVDVDQNAKVNLHPGQTTQNKVYGLSVSGQGTLNLSMMINDALKAFTNAKKKKLPVNMNLINIKNYNDAPDININGGQLNIKPLNNGNIAGDLNAPYSYLNINGGQFNAKYSGSQNNSIIKFNDGDLKDIFTDPVKLIKNNSTYKGIADGAYGAFNAAVTTSKIPFIGSITQGLLNTVFPGYNNIKSEDDFINTLLNDATNDMNKLGQLIKVPGLDNLFNLKALAKNVASSFPGDPNLTNNGSYNNTAIKAPDSYSYTNLIDEAQSDLNLINADANTNSVKQNASASAELQNDLQTAQLASSVINQDAQDSADLYSYEDANTEINNDQATVKIASSEAAKAQSDIPNRPQSSSSNSNSSSSNDNSQYLVQIQSDSASISTDNTEIKSIAANSDVQNNVSIAKDIASDETIGQQASESVNRDLNNADAAKASIANSEVAVANSAVNNANSVASSIVAFDNSSYNYSRIYTDSCAVSYNISAMKSEETNAGRVDNKQSLNTIQHNNDIATNAQKTINHDLLVNDRKALSNANYENQLVKKASRKVYDTIYSDEVNRNYAYIYNDLYNVDYSLKYVNRLKANTHNGLILQKINNQIAYIENEINLLNSYFPDATDKNVANADSVVNNVEKASNDVQKEYNQK